MNRSTVEASEYCSLKQLERIKSNNYLGQNCKKDYDSASVDRLIYKKLSKMAWDDWKSKEKQFDEYQKTIDDYENAIRITGEAENLRGLYFKIVGNENLWGVLLSRDNEKKVLLGAGQFFLTRKDVVEFCAREFLRYEL